MEASGSGSLIEETPDAGGSSGLGAEVAAGSTGGPSGPRAGFWRRFGALLIDGLILGFVAAILELLLKGFGSALAVIVYAGYFTYFEGGPSGQTPGKSVLGIRVVGFDTGGPIGYGRGFIRLVGRIVSGIFLDLGYFWMLWDPEKQCWHDKFASDVVVPVADYPVGG
jgi:uncharacterized RDD family membrane protein YckC